VVIGNNAGRSITTANSNVNIGNDAGSSTTTGNGNIAIGNISLMGNTTGEFNLAIGNNTHNVSGSRNIFVGASSAEQNTSGGGQRGRRGVRPQPQPNGLT
jgi:hypothetical protein